MEFVVSHPLWVRIIGWIFLPIMGAVSLWLLTMPIWKSNYEIILLASCALLGGFPLYMTYQSFKVFPYLRSDIKVDDSGFTITQPSGVSKKYEWSSIGKLTHYATAQVLEIRNNNDELILAITEQASKYGLFVSLMNLKTGHEV